MAMRIVDSQAHIWYPNTPERPWSSARPEVKPHRNRPFFVLEDLLAEMRAAGVARVILTQAVFEGERIDKMIEAVRLYPDLFAIIDHFRLQIPETREKMTAWKPQSGILGVRVSFLHDAVISLCAS